MPETDKQELVTRALAREPGAVRALVGLLSPIVERRVVTALWRRSPGRDARQEVADMTQEVFLALFNADGKALRAWDPARGLSLENFVGLLAQHQVASLLRNGRTTPWRDDPTDSSEIESLAGTDAGADAVLSSRDEARRLLHALSERLSPRGLELFERLIVDEEPIDAVASATGLTRDALYQWRSRILKTARELGRELKNTSALSDPAPVVRRPVGGPPS